MTGRPPSPGSQLPQLATVNEIGAAIDRSAEQVRIEIRDQVASIHAHLDRLPTLLAEAERDNLRDELEAMRNEFEAKLAALQTQIEQLQARQVGG